jgi:hypothetical protein
LRYPIDDVLHKVLFIPQERRTRPFRYPSLHQLPYIAMRQAIIPVVISHRVVPPSPIIGMCCGVEGGHRDVASASSGRRGGVVAVVASAVSVWGITTGVVIVVVGKGGKGGRAGTGLGLLSVLGGMGRKLVIRIVIEEGGHRLLIVLPIEVQDSW